MKSLIAMICMLCLGYTASAQMNSSTGGSGGGNSYGVRVGATFSTINLSKEIEEIVAITSTTGVQVGALANFYISDVFSLQPEILFIQKGYKSTLKTEETYPDFAYTEEKILELKSNYVEVPVLAKASLGSGNVNFFVTAGPTIGYWISSKEKEDYTLTYTDGIDTFVDPKSKSTERDIDFDDSYKRLEIGASLGVGVGYKVGTGALNLDVRYGLGLTDIYETDENGQAKNRVFGVALAYLFGR